MEIIFKQEREHISSFKNILCIWNIKTQNYTLFYMCKNTFPYIIYPKWRISTVQALENLKVVESLFYLQKEVTSS